MREVEFLSSCGVPYVYNRHTEGRVLALRKCLNRDGSIGDLWVDVTDWTQRQLEVFSKDKCPTCGNRGAPTLQRVGDMGTICCTLCGAHFKAA